MSSDLNELYAKTNVLHLPCFAPVGTRIFAPTADQRFLAGPDEFLRTHFPMRLHSYNTGCSTLYTEQEMLNCLLNPSPSVVGNRVFVLYGAAGSGKSELMRWLQTHISFQDQGRAAVTMRISRTELDIFHIAQRLQQLHSSSSFQSTTAKRWEECRQKPRTLAKILVLTALEQLLDSDDQINAIYYQLIDIVQANLERCFTAMAQPTTEIGQFIDLFSREDLEGLFRDSVITIPIEYETLRYYILKVFRDQLLEGLDIPYTLKSISLSIHQEKQLRPILFIDDLVQSINLFATDLLDYFLTLEEGCWDVIIGITPNSLEASMRGKELLNRIAYLDTIDDRVEKFWLSDEYGLISSFLNEDNCTEFARLYLNEYKRQNQRPCNDSCPAFSRCSHLETERASDLLAPFNKYMLIRLFRSLPSDKGKVRYFTLYLRNILERITRGEDILIVLQEYIKSEQAAYHPNKRLAQIYELYGPFPNKDVADTGVLDTVSFYQFFDVEPSVEQMQELVLASLYRNVQGTERDGLSAVNSSLIIQTIDPGKEAIKDWLKGEVVNKQQLRNVRRGVVKAIKDGFLLDILTRLYTAKPTRILHWTQTRFDTVPPVTLEDIDEFHGLLVQRDVGSLAYIFHDFADASGLSEQVLRKQLLAHEAFPQIMFQAKAYRKKIQDELEACLGMQTEVFAFSLLVLGAHLASCPVGLPLLFEQKLTIERDLQRRYPESIEAERPRLTHGQLGAIRRLFDDCFKLRENVYDGLLLESIVEEIDAKRAMAMLMQIDPHSIATDVQLNDEPLGTFVAAVQSELLSLASLKEREAVKVALTSACSPSLGENEALSQLTTLLRLSIEVEASVINFLRDCHPLDLHKALLLARTVIATQFEYSINQLHSALAELLQGRSEFEQQATRLTEVFTKADADLLLRLSQQECRLPVSQLDATFLSKVAHYLPGVYQRLELRLQRG